MGCLTQPIQSRWQHRNRHALRSRRDSRRIVGAVKRGHIRKTTYATCRLATLGVLSWVHLRSKRCEQTSTVIIPNPTVAEWGSVFGDAKMTTARLDWLTHHCHIVETGNGRYRFGQSSAQAKSRIGAREATRPP